MKEEKFSVFENRIREEPQTSHKVEFISNIHRFAFYRYRINEQADI